MSSNIVRKEIGVDTGTPFIVTSVFNQPPQSKNSVTHTQDESFH